MKSLVRPHLLAVALALGAPISVGAQQPAAWDARGPEMTRAELDSLLARLNRAAASTAYSQELRQRTRAEALLVQERLKAGDFQPGDRIWLQVDGERTLTDTFVVAPGPSLTLPIAGDIALPGVLRSELARYLTGRIGDYVRNPVVHVRSLVRLSVVGGVTRPGFFVVPADTPLPDILMLAGGPGPDVDLKDLRVDRGTERLWEGEALQLATRQGRTVDQLNLRAGDQIVVPRPSHGSFDKVARVVGLLVTIPAALYGIIQLVN